MLQLPLHLLFIVFHVILSLFQVLVMEELLLHSLTLTQILLLVLHQEQPEQELHLLM
jgi:hypothetical protein